MTAAAPLGPPVCMGRLLQMIRKRFPGLQFGYFNPPKERFTNLAAADQKEKAP